MIVLSGAAGRLRDLDFLRERGHGRLLGPGGWKNPKPGVVYGLDNGAFSAWTKGTPFPEKAFLRLLAKVPRDDPPFLVVCPDKVAAGMESLRFSKRWRTRLSKLGYDWLPWYLAVQDGMTAEAVAREICTDRWAGLFVGGTVAWKRRTAASWVDLAHAYGLKAHVGRTPQLQDLVWAERIGADSCDSTNFARNDRHHVIDAARLQASLFPPETPTP